MKILCVGGPWDGQVWEVNTPGPYIEAASRPVCTVPLAAPRCSEEIIPERRMRAVYTGRKFRSPDGDMELWAPQELTDFDVLVRLVNHYFRLPLVSRDPVAKPPKTG